MHEQHDVKSDTSKNINIGKHFMVPGEKKLSQLEG